MEAELRFNATDLRLEVARATEQTWISTCEEGRRGSLTGVGTTHHMGKPQLSIQKIFKTSSCDWVNTAAISLLIARPHWIAMARSGPR